MDPVGLVVGGTLAYLGSSYLQSSPIYVDGWELWADWTAWGIIALLCWLRSLYSAREGSHFLFENEKHDLPSPKWSNDQLTDHGATLVAFLLVTAHFIATRLPGEELQWAFPILTLFTFLLITLDHVMPSQLSDSDLEAHQVWRKILPPSVHRKCDSALTIPLAIVTALILAFVLLPANIITHLNICVLGIVYAALTATAYLLLSQMSCASSVNGLDCSLSPAFSSHTASISIRAFTMCSLLLVLTSAPIPSFWFSVFPLAVLKVVQISAIVCLCWTNLAIAAATMLTSSAAIAGGIITTIPFPDTVLFLVTFVSLNQAYSSLPKARSSRAWLFLILLTPLVRVLFHPETIFNPGLLASGSPVTSDIPIGSVHPIRRLTKENQILFEQKVASQSRTVEEGVREYKRRYGRIPPPGFDKWFEIARSKDFLFIDELDTVMESLEPFWGVNPAALRASIKSVQKAEHISSVTVGYEQISHSGDSYHVDFMKEWLNRTTWGDIVPEVSLVVSTIDEPRVVVPDDTLRSAMKKIAESKKEKEELELTKPNPWWTKATVDSPPGRGRRTSSLTKSEAKSDNIKWINVGKQDAWEAMVSSCHLDDPARSDMSTPTIAKPVLPFVDNTTTNVDVCASSDLLHNHGFLTSPHSLLITHSLVPIFSQCKPSIFNDILYPSPYYQMQIRSGDYIDAEDPEWDQKLDRMYWAGAGTGGYTTSQNWMRTHRQRLTMMTASDNGYSVNLLEQDTIGDWQPRTTTWSDISDMFYMRLTGICQCSEESCQAQVQRFHGPQELKSAALENKYMLDIDGNTFSGRYYRLLKSKGAVLKYTVFKEWHDGRLMPWVHFIPVSAGAEELGEIMRYLLNEEEGREIGRLIAEESRKWARKTLREEDLEVVFVRVLMEYARIMNDDRENMGYVGKEV